MNTKLEPPGCNFFIDRLKRFCKGNKYGCYSYCAKHIGSQKPAYDFERPDECPVCCDEFGDTSRALVCGHWIHVDCIVKSGHMRCPICRTAVYLSTKDRRRCNQYRQDYQVNDTYVTNTTRPLAAHVDTLLQRYPPNIRQFISEVGVDNIIDPHLYTVNPVMFQNVLLEYVDNFVEIVALVSGYTSPASSSVSSGASTPVRAS